MPWLLVSTPDDVCLVKQDDFCQRCFELKTRKTILENKPLDGEEREEWIKIARDKQIKVYGTVTCVCFTPLHI